MQSRKAAILTAVIASMFLATAAQAVYILNTPFEEKCAAGMSKTLAKFTGAKAKCVTKCQQGARKVPPTNPFTDCVAPYAGTTSVCISDPVKGAEAKAIASAEKGCVIDCPECYSGGDCATYIPGRVASIESQLDVFVSLIWCDDSGSGDGLNPAEAKCQDTVAKTLAKFVASKDKCYDKCAAAEFKNKIPPFSCIPPAIDPATVVCISLAEQKAIASIDKICTLDEPECYVPNFDNGAEWVGLAEGAVDANIVQTYCGSPSGAFVE